jgi:hypothetical protein
MSHQDGTLVFPLLADAMFESPRKISGPVPNTLILKLVFHRHDTLLLEMLFASPPPHWYHQCKPAGLLLKALCCTGGGLVLKQAPPVEPKPVLAISLIMPPSAVLTGQPTEHRKSCAILPSQPRY